jgi:hypothetical protein
MMNLHDRNPARDPGLEIRVSIDGDAKRDKEDVKGGLIARQDRWEFVKAGSATRKVEPFSGVLSTLTVP